MSSFSLQSPVRRNHSIPRRMRDSDNWSASFVLIKCENLLSICFNKSQFFSVLGLMERKICNINWSLWKISKRETIEIWFFWNPAYQIPSYLWYLIFFICCFDIQLTVSNELYKIVFSCSLKWTPCGMKDPDISFLTSWRNCLFVL